jgi:hypothetical protein
MRKSKFQVTKPLVLLLAIGIFNCAYNLYAAESEPKTAEELTGCIRQASSASQACLEDLKNIYFQGDRYADFVELLKGLSPANKSIEPALNYYIALSRYTQLKYLEESKGWDEYFAKGNDYRADIVSAAQKAIKATGLSEPVQVYSKLLLFQFHKDQQDSFTEGALTDLMASAAACAQSGGDMKIIKGVADKLSAYGEKGKAKELYKIYAQKLSGSQIQD